MRRKARSKRYVVEYIDGAGVGENHIHGDFSISALTPTAAKNDAEEWRRVTERLRERKIQIVSVRRTRQLASMNRLAAVESIAYAAKNIRKRFAVSSDGMNANASLREMFDNDGPTRAMVRRAATIPVGGTIRRSGFVIKRTK